MIQSLFHDLAWTIPGIRLKISLPLQFTDEFPEHLPLPCEKLIPPSNDARRNAQFVGQKDDLLLAATVRNPSIMLGGNKGFRSKGIGLFFSEVTIALVVDEEPLLLVLEHMASFMEK